MSKITTLATRSLGKTGFVLQKYSPQILTVGGVVGVVASTVLIARATLKLEETHERGVERVKNVKDLKQYADANQGNPDYKGEAYNEKTYLRDLTAAYTHIVIDYTKLYGPGVVLSVASIAMILGGHSIEHKRNLGMVAAYKALETSVNEYRKRVIDEIGVEAEEKIRKNVVSKVSKAVEGLEEEGKVEQIEVRREGHSQYARFFDESNKNFSKAPHMNLFWLRAQQHYLNQKLNADGFVFLNDVYVALGFDRVPTGQVFGWILDPDSDNVIDFGMYNKDDEAKRLFINGDEKAILLDFNIDPKPIWDRIDQFN